MRIVIVSGIFPPDVGGPATYVPSIASALVGRGDRVTVVAMSDDGPSPDHGRPFELVRISRHGGRMVRWSAALNAIIDAGRGADVVYAAGLLPQAAAATLRLRRPLVARVVSDVAWDRATAYGWSADTLETFQRTRYGVRIQALKTVQRWAIRRAAFVIVPSSWLASWLSRLGVPPERVRVIPNALAPLPAVRPNRPAAPTPYLIATVGRLVPVKQVDLIIHALRDLPEASLLVIGDGPEKAALQQLAADFDLTPRVIFAGARPRDDVLAMLAGCDVLVQCSAHEGFPFVLLEAMSLGVPVIATPVGGVPEIVEDGTNGILVRGTAPLLADALHRLLADAEWRGRLGRRARVDVSRRSDEAMVDATRAVLGEAIR